MIRRVFWTVLSGLLLAAPVAAESKTYPLAVAAGDTDRTNTPVKVLLWVPPELAKAENVLIEDAAGKKWPGQLTPPGLLVHVPRANTTDEPRELHFILPSLKAGNSAVFKAIISTDAPTKTESFTWKELPDQTAELQFGKRPVLLYMGLAYDESSKDKRDVTYKVFHHLYDPDGERQVTQGSGGKLDPHHRGIYYGFNQITHGDGKKCDTWHCTNGAHQSHQKFLSREAGPVLGRHRVEIGWHGQDKKIFAVEQRELTVYHVPGGQLVEFRSRLTSKDGKIKLDGDPQHAGFQFRANGEVAEKTAKQTIYIRPDGVGKPGETRNWDAKKPDDHANLPWNAMSFVLNDQRYTIAYLDRPTNPKPARFSERDYGRFGSYFVQEMDEKKPCDVAYRLWLQKGEMKGTDVAVLDADFVKPPQVTVK
ncbi:MAG: PmoA family protein [Gemmataceae bacterium]|nr:PmoA family protein [Gemmataceae bacterium]